jgi:prepilin-type processing-associated H-X9-DG protein
MKSQLYHPAPDRAAFTLVELLAVAGVIGLLGITLATSVATVQPNGQGARCLNNQRQLALAWRMYADDNQGLLAPNIDSSEAGEIKTAPSWSGGWLDFTSSPDNTNVALLIDHHRYPYGAYLGPYVKTPAVFKCPSDKSVTRIQGRIHPRVRSVSMNNYMGVGSRAWQVPSRYPVNTRISRIHAPADTFVFLDEREDSINDPLFFTNAERRYNMIDFPASYHAGAGAFSFADGHAEIHRWSDPRTMPPLRPGALLTLNIPLLGNEDVDWLQAKAVGAKNLWP